MRTTLARLPFLSSNPADPAAVLNTRSQPRKVDPEVDRESISEADLPRIISSPWIFRRRGITIISYLFIVFACLVIAAIGYSTFTFSRYQNVILPGIYISSVNAGNMTPTQAANVVTERIYAMDQVPIRFTYRRHTYMPSVPQIDLSYDVPTTVANAFSIGRSGSIWSNLIERFPIHRRFNVRLITPYKRYLASEWIDSTLVTPVQRPMVNAWLKIAGDRAVVEPSQTGQETNTRKALQELEAAMGSLSIHRIPIPLNSKAPAVTDATAHAVAARVNDFLRNPPVLKFGKHLITTGSGVLASMIYLPPRPTGTRVTTIKPEITDQQAISAYAQQLCDSFDEAPQSPQSTYDGGAVDVVVPGRPGRTVNAITAYKGLLKAFTALTPNARISVPVQSVPVPSETSDPASVGITTFLGEGQISYAGAPPARALDIQSIAAQLNGVVIAPGDDISFDDYAGRGPGGASWPSRVYSDGERIADGRPEMSVGGAIDQVATAFFQAGYAAGLTVLERHPHTYLLPWYKPVGMDAMVSAIGDLRFRNSTGGYLLIQTLFQPAQQSLMVYVYGRNTGWSVQVSQPVVSAQTAPGPPIKQLDQTLSKGTRVVENLPLDGETAVVTRTVTVHHRKGKATSSTDTQESIYSPRQKLVLIGTYVPRPTPTPTPKPSPSPTPTSTPVPSATASPTPTPTHPSLLGGTPH